MNDLIFTTLELNEFEIFMRNNFSHYTQIEELYKYRKARNLGGSYCRCQRKR